MSADLPLHAASTVTVQPSRWTIAMAGAVALAVAMGIGRFAFTPLLPIMLADGVVDLRGASWLASANYLGYLAGALLCTFQPWISVRVPSLPAVDGVWMIRAGLVATAVLTLGMALPWPAVWPLLRFAAGVASALVFVYSSGWCLGELARRGAPALGGAMFTGPGAGIMLSGVLASAMVAWQWRAAAGWALFGLLAFALTASVWRAFRVSPSLPPMRAAQSSQSSQTSRTSQPSQLSQPSQSPQSATAKPDGANGRTSRTEVAWLAFAYGLAGFGYIITATFLPVIARQVLPDSHWLDFFWPLFGLGIVSGALLATRLRVTGDLRLLLAGSYLLQATAIAASIVSPTLAGFAFGSLLLGLPFTAITFFAMQEVRRLRPAHSASTMGLLTALYGIGQIVGPPLVAALLHRTSSAQAGFTLSLEIAASALLAGALIFVGMSRAFPKAD